MGKETVNQVQEVQRVLGKIDKEEHVKTHNNQIGKNLRQR